MHCTNADCSGSQSSVTLTEAPGGDPSLVLTTTGLPVIAWVVGDEVHVVTCQSANCAGVRTANSWSITGPSDRVGLALRSDGTPVVAYYDRDEGLEVASCTDAACATTPSLQSPDPTSIHQ